MKKVTAYKYDIKLIPLLGYADIPPERIKPLDIIEAYTISDEQEIVDLEVLDIKLTNATIKCHISSYSYTGYRLPCPHCRNLITKDIQVWVDKLFYMPIYENILTVVLCRKCFKTAKMFPFAESEKQELVYNNESNIKFILEATNNRKIRELKDNYFVTKMVYTT